MTCLHVLTVDHQQHLRQSFRYQEVWKDRPKKEETQSLKETPIDPYCRIQVGEPSINHPQMQLYCTLGIRCSLTPHACRRARLPMGIPITNEIAPTSCMHDSKQPET
jgi:hypothetical protein